MKKRHVHVLHVLLDCGRDSGMQSSACVNACAYIGRREEGSISGGAWAVMSHSCSCTFLGGVVRSNVALVGVVFPPSQLLHDC